MPSTEIRTKGTKVLEKQLHTIKDLFGVSRTPKDCRSGRIIAVIECILNQNARDAGAASFPAMNFELLQLCHRYGIGILQMPCPEVAALGAERKRRAGQSLREAMETQAGRCRCRALACDVADAIQTSIAHGCDVVAVLGGNPQSPGCAVHDGPDGLCDTSGVFMTALQTELRRRKCNPAFHGMRDADPAQLREDLAWLKERLESAATYGRPAG